ncbi:helix-turn-helix transcriptional regulator [Alloactinosynnema sp. L-07]|uniref:helix-turn-helix domain-containing protein n=1 Tax=Alloactinosynnema sp. L-07 TaxID=1653480 RepID=UPI0009EDB85E|nr:helix-turn-helix transcriptional regulator [Alloactinosynnema sp. L-07]
MFDPERQQRERRDLADALRDMRRAAGLSGERLAARCAMSQSKISRIERGKILPSVTDVERILSALGVDPKETQQFLDLARTANVHYRSIRALAEIGLWRGQNELSALVASSTQVRYFCPAAPSGMMQTPEYAAAILTPTVRGRPARNVERAVEARIERQTALYDASRSFTFVTTEQAVRWNQAPAEVMAAQARHMADLAELPNVTIAVVPNDAQMNAVPLSSFVVYDERFVMCELFSGSVILRDPQEVAYHVNVLEHFQERARVNQEAATFLRQMANES